MRTLTIDFFHDVVCCWCFNMSSRLRQLAGEFDLDIRHRTFVLQASRAEMAARWGSPAMARKTILGHWAACRAASDRPDQIDIAAMRRAPFDYPHGHVAARACKAAEALAGQDAHWRMFDRLQRAHLSEARDIADPAVVLDVARAAGFEAAAFAAHLDAPVTARAVEDDRRLARSLGVRVVPTLHIRELNTPLATGTLPELRAQLRSAIALSV